MKKITFLKPIGFGALCLASLATSALAQQSSSPTVTNNTEAIARFDYAPEPDGAQRVPEIRATLVFTWDNPGDLSRNLDIVHKIFVKVPWQTNRMVVTDTGTFPIPGHAGNTETFVFRTALFGSSTYDSEHSISGATGFFPKTGTAGPLTTGPGF